MDEVSQSSTPHHTASRSTPVAPPGAPPVEDEPTANEMVAVILMLAEIIHDDHPEAETLVEVAELSADLSPDCRWALHHVDAWIPTWDIEADPEFAAELRRRIADHEAGRSKTRPWSEVKAELALEDD